MVRYITNKITDPLTNNYLLFARRVIRRKSLILIFEELEEGMRHVSKCFGWDNQEDAECVPMMIVT